MKLSMYMGHGGTHLEFQHLRGGLRAQGYCQLCIQFQGQPGPQESLSQKTKTNEKKRKKEEEMKEKRERKKTIHIKPLTNDLAP